ncbi:sugar ABC transporter ATP-binding protein [Terrabacter terrigena]|uniref:Sugar ABC transporter ATP-binding protein n=1 Tax=Terrabacter terrigena TaxID=574718 RepID=A0ABW3MZ54_9MICO
MTAVTHEGTSALRIERLSKRFGGAHALDDVALEIRAGEIHGLLGENGSGKSTLIKVLAGYHTPEPGALISVGDVPVDGTLDQKQLRRLGLSFVHQDLGLIPSLTVTDNFMLVEQDELSPLRISWSRQRRRVAEALRSYGVDVDPAAVVEQLSPLQQALVAVVRAVGRREDDHPLRLLILDEPTVFLPAKEVGMLFSLMRRVAAEGAGVLFVTHDMGEVLEVTDRVTVLRDGRLRGTRETGATSERELIELILGHTWAQAHALQDRQDRRAGAELVQVSGLSGGGLHDISLSVHEGEVLGVTGLVGSGFEQLPYLLLGGKKADTGRLRVGAWEHDLTSLRASDAVAAGVVLVPGNRLADGVVADFTVSENMTLPVLPRFFRGGRLRRRNLVDHALGLMRRVDVRPLAPEAPISSLSGGNQQKAVIAKWLQLEPRLLILHEPTQGVDVGARAQIVKEIRSAAKAGTAVIVATSDYEHLEDAADRVLVLANGVLREELTGSQVSRHNISEKCLMSTSVASAGTLAAEATAHPADVDGARE